MSDAVSTDGTAQRVQGGEQEVVAAAAGGGAVGGWRRRRVAGGDTLGLAATAA